MFEIEVGWIAREVPSLARGWPWIKKKGAIGPQGEALTASRALLASSSKELGLGLNLSGQGQEVALEQTQSRSEAAEERSDRRVVMGK